MEIIMFLVAGISPKIKILDNTPRICPICGLAQAYQKRIDHYLSLFFIPLVKVKKGEPFIACNRCEREVHDSESGYNAWSGKHDAKCDNCGRILKDDFMYCPYCGKSSGK